MMVGNYKRKVASGVYINNQQQEIREFGGGRGADILRIGIKSLKVLGGGLLVGGAGIETANTLGRDLGYGNVGTEAFKDIAKKLGIHK